MSFSSNNPNNNGGSYGNGDRNSLNKSKSKSSGLLSSLLNSMQKTSLPQIPQINAITERDLIQKKGSISPQDVLKLKRYTESNAFNF
jgi:hypothetical protein